VDGCKEGGERRSSLEICGREKEESGSFILSSKLKLDIQKGYQKRIVLGGEKDMS